MNILNLLEIIGFVEKGFLHEYTFKDYKFNISQNYKFNNSHNKKDNLYYSFSKKVDENYKGKYYFSLIDPQRSKYIYIFESIYDTEYCISKLKKEFQKELRKYKIEKILKNTI